MRKTQAQPRTTAESVLTCSPPRTNVDAVRIITSKFRLSSVREGVCLNLAVKLRAFVDRVCKEPPASCSGTSSVITVNCRRFAMPNDVVSATSDASRPTAISTRPIARPIVARIESPPAVLQVCFEPRAEIHRYRRSRDPDVSQISCRIAGRYIQCPAHRYRQVLEIAANPEAISKDVESCFHRVRILVSECHFFVYPGTHGLYSIPARRHTAEKLRCNVGHSVDFTIAAVIKVPNCIDRQILHWYLARPRRDRIRSTRIVNQCRIHQPDLAGRGQKAAGVISKRIEITFHACCRFERYLVRLAQIICAGRVDFQESDHRCWTRRVENNVVPQAN